MKEAIDLRLAALGFLREWSVWMVGVQTVLLGFLVSLLSRNQIALGSYYLKGAVVCFGLSIALAACVLGALPSISQRLPGREHGIYQFAVVDFPLLRRFRLGGLAFLQHLFFFLGLLGLILAILMRQIG